MDTSKGNDASQNCGQIDKEQEKSLCRPAVRIRFTLSGVCDNITS